MRIKYLILFRNSITFIDELEKWVEEGKITPDDIITHAMPLSEAAHAY